jgi:hypothetical protein
LFSVLLKFRITTHTCFGFSYKKYNCNLLTSPRSSRQQRLGIASSPERLLRPKLGIKKRCFNRFCPNSDTDYHLSVFVEYLRISSNKGLDWLRLRRRVPAFRWQQDNMPSRSPGAGFFPKYSKSDQRGHQSYRPYFEAHRRLLIKKGCFSRTPAQIFHLYSSVKSHLDA